jgi:acid stress-induced BolA-like protein IbaG/YrbA
MPATVDEVKQLIEQAFPGSNADDVKEQNHRIVGMIVWKDFKGKDVIERNRLVTDLVRNKLGYKGLNIGHLVPLAPGDKL